MTPMPKDEPAAEGAAGKTDDIPEIRMADRCATCAFRAGTDAARSPLTQHKARACLATGTPFLCHESPIPAMCSGWTDALMKQMAAGEVIPEWRRQVSLAILDAIEVAEDGGDPDLFKMLAERMAAMEDQR